MGGSTDGSLKLDRWRNTLRFGGICGGRMHANQSWNGTKAAGTLLKDNGRDFIYRLLKRTFYQLPGPIGEKKTAADGCTFSFSSLDLELVFRLGAWGVHMKNFAAAEVVFGFGKVH